MLVTEKMNDAARERIRTLVDSNDGFYIAEMDMKLRGPGEFFGTQAIRAAGAADRQHSARREILEIARREAVAFMAHPPSRRGAAARGRLHSRSLAAALRTGEGGLMRVIGGRISRPGAEEPSGTGRAADAGPAARDAVQYSGAARSQGAVFVDAYAGTGAVGIEALSRGASRAVFIEHNRAAANVIRDNLRALGLEGRATLRQSRASAVLTTIEADFVFLDPPYRLETEYGRSLEMLGDAPPRLAIVQHSSRVALETRYGKLRRRRVLKQGSNALSFFEPEA